MAATVPVSALGGWNVVDRHSGWCKAEGPSLLQILELPPNTRPTPALPAFPQWVEKFVVRHQPGSPRVLGAV